MNELEMGKFLSEPQFSLLEDWDINALFLITLLLGLNEIIMHVK